ncbi:MAG: glycosyltransferase family 2 protein [Candidatus Doudnabacteria bacterium]|nr:glycosyltransferase family 2 protein [Candidatus Doudnabacteria bacterium]
MPKVILVQVVYNNIKWIPLCFDAVFKQTYTDFKFVVVIAGNEDGSKEYIEKHYTQVEIIDPGYNIGFAKGHNLVFEKYLESAKYFQLVNPDLVMEADYLEKMVRAMEAGQRVGGATGKLYKISNEDTRGILVRQKDSPCVIDTTGVVISKSGRARDRGQHEEDRGQYDNLTEVNAVSAAGAMYRAACLQATGYSLQAKKEFFDEDFHSYWEDVDLSWRMKNAGFKNIFVPEAVAYHGRTAGSSKGGYKDVFGFIKHHKKLSKFVRQLNYKNHVFMYIKNSPNFYPQFFIREFFMLGYIVLFEASTLKVIPEMFRLLPRMWKKRRIIQKINDSI